MSGKGTSARVVPATLDALDGMDVDTLLLMVAEDERPWQGAAGLVDWRMCGWFTSLLLSAEVTGRSGERVLCHVNGRVPVQRVILVGAGPRKSAESRVADLVRDADRVLADARAATAALGACLPAGVLARALEAGPSSLRERVRLVLDTPPA